MGPHRTTLCVRRMVELSRSLHGDKVVVMLVMSKPVQGAVCMRFLGRSAETSVTERMRWFRRRAEAFSVPLHRQRLG